MRVVSPHTELCCAKDTGFGPQPSRRGRFSFEAARFSASVCICLAAGSVHLPLKGGGRLAHQPGGGRDPLPIPPLFKGREENASRALTWRSRPCHRGFSTRWGEFPCSIPPC